MNEPKRFKCNVTTFEQLPNELFIEVFAFLNGVDTVYAFSQLNNRFQSLLIQHVNTFDFKSINKVQFDDVIQYHDIHQWRSLRLSEDDTTPGQIRLFCQLYPPHQYISQLQSLCALNMTLEYASEFLSQLASFDHLASLELGNICGKYVQPFELPSLKRLIVTGCKHTGWLMKLQSLENLEYNIGYRCYHECVFRFPAALKQLKLLYDEQTDGDAVRGSLYQLSRLTKLALYDSGSRSSLPNGEAWEELIQTSLPLLETFQFCFCFRRYGTALNHIQQTVASFSTPFYLNIKRWFIRCDYDCRYSTTGSFYSLPFAFVQMPINISSFDTSVSTLDVSDMNKTTFESYKKVKALFLNTRCLIPYQRFHTLNIVRLVLNANFSANWIFLLTNLHALEIRRSRSISSNDFAQLLASSVKLRSLTISTEELETLTDKFTNIAVCDHLCQLIESLRLAVFSENKFILDIVKVRLLSPLVRIFSKKCKHLSLALAVHPNTVLPILQRMEQLRSLHIQCNPWYCRSRNIVKSWLHQQSTDPTQLDFVHITNENDYCVWFGNRP